MFRIDDATAATSLPVPETAGTEGYFTEGNPTAGTPATNVRASWLNMIQEELRAVVVAGGQAPSKTSYNQLLMAIKRLTQAQVVLADTGTANAYAVVNTPAFTSSTWTSGVVLQFVVAHTNTGASTFAPDGLTPIPIYGLGLQPLQGNELVVGGTAIVMRTTIAGVNGGNPICVLMECAGGAQQVASATQSGHAVNLGQLQSLTGTGTTQPQFDASTKYATTAFVQRAIGNSSFFSGVAASTTLTAANAGNTIVPTAAVAITMPLGTSVAAGTRIKFLSLVAGATVVRQGSDVFDASNSNGAITSIALNMGDTLELESGGGASWYIVGGSAGLQYSSAFMSAAGIAPINNTGASSDISLLPNQSAYIDIASATSVPLHIATGDNQLYEIELAMTGGTGGSGAYLLPNNASITNGFICDAVFNATSNASYSNSYQAGFLFGVYEIRRAFMRASTKTIAKNTVTSFTGYSGSYMAAGTAGATWVATAGNYPSDTTTAWTSLGTVSFSTPSTGRIYIRRIA